MWNILHAALERARKADKIASDKAWRDVEFPKGVDAARIRYLTVDDARRLINACEGADFKALVRAALVTGARYSELAALQVQDFNLDAGTLHIRTSKSGKSRHVILTDEAIGLFTILTAGRAGSELILRKDGERWRKSNQDRLMRAAVARAKINPPIPFHGLRHSYASLAIMAGAEPMVIAQSLGHADLRMVTAHYGHLSPSYMRDVIRKSVPTFVEAEDDDGNVVPLRGAR